MCLIIFAWDVHPKYQLILAANRDEFYQRPSATAGFWQDQPDILGGRDLQAGGSWMTLSRFGRFAAVTNYRDPANINPDALSRGELTTQFMNSREEPSAYVANLHNQAGQYNGFNLLVCNLEEMVHYSNYERKLNVLKPGVYGLSNALLDTEWPKVIQSKQRFEKLIASQFTHEDLIKMMGDTEEAYDALLPSTGVSKELERALSPVCIRMDNYGTCCTTILTIDRDTQVNFTEKSYPVGNRQDTSVNYQFQISDQASA